jgi:hypothetical protein
MAIHRWGNSTGTIGTNIYQRAALDADLATLRKTIGVLDIRVNQQQTAIGERVGINRPDLQYIQPQLQFTENGVRYYIEY